MRDLDERLAEYGERWRAEQPPMTPMQPSTDRTWWTPVAAAAAILLVTGGVTFAASRDEDRRPDVIQATQPPAPPVPSVIPWIDTPGVLAVVVPANAPPCVASALEFVDVGAEGAMSQIFQIVRVRNIGDQPCSVPAITAIRVFAPDGRRLDAESHVGGGSTPESSYVVRPGDTASSSIFAGMTCPPTPVSRLEIDLDGGSSFNVPLPAPWIPDECEPGTVRPADRLSVNAVNFTRDGESTLPELDGMLAVHVGPFEAVQPGGLLKFRTKVTNTTDNPVRLEPCPSYTMQLSDPRVGELPARTYLLNCADGNIVPAHGSLTFAMQLETTGLPSGQMAGVSWRWEDSKPYNGGVIVVGVPIGASCGRANGVHETGDVDGKNPPEAVAHYYDESAAYSFVTVVCFANGRTIEARDLGAESFAVEDIDDDGRAEILGGGTSVSEGSMTVYRVLADSIVPVTFKGAPFAVEWGTEKVVDQGNNHYVVTKTKSWGCQDVIGDGRREVVQLHVDYERHQRHVEAFRIEGTTVTQVLDRTETIPSQYDSEHPATEDSVPDCSESA